MFENNLAYNRLRAGLYNNAAQTEGNKQENEQTRQSALMQFDIPMSERETQLAYLIMAIAENPEQEKEKIQQALIYSREESNLPFNIAYANLDVLHEARTEKPLELSKTGTLALVDSFKAGNLTVESSRVAEKLYFAKKRGEDTSTLEKQMEELDKQMLALQDNGNQKWYRKLLNAVANTISYSYNVAKASTLGSLVGNLVSPGFGTLLSIAAGTVEGFRIIRYRNWYDLVQNGVDEDTAEWTSFMSGGIQAVIESVLGIETQLGRALTGTGSRFLAKTMTNLWGNGALTSLGVFAVNWLKNGTAQGLEEFLQKITEDIFNNIAYANSEMDSPYTVGQTLKDSLYEFIYGAGVGLVLGPVGSYVETRNAIGNNIQYATEVRKDALNNDSKQDFISKHMQDEELRGVREDTRREDLGKIYDDTNRMLENAQKILAGVTEEEARTVDSDLIEQPDIVGQEDEEGNVVEAETSEQFPEIKRFENGRLRVQENEDAVVQLPDGSERRQLLVGTAENSSRRYGYINYTINPDGSISIDLVSTRKESAAITKDAVNELMRRYPGADFNWDPTTKFQKAIKEQILGESTQEGKLNKWTGLTDADEMKDISAKIKQAFPSLSRAESDVGAVLIQLLGQQKNMTGQEYLSGYVQEMRQAKDKELERNEQGRTTFEEFDGQIKAVVASGRKANFSTFVHETSHVIRTNMTDAENRRMISAFKNAAKTEQFKRFVDEYKLLLQDSYENVLKTIESMNTNPDKKSGKWNWTQTQEELFARMFEAYLMEGRTFNSELTNIFAKMKDFFRKIYRALSGQKLLSDEIVRAYDSLFMKEDMQEAEANYVAQQEQQNAEATTEEATGDTGVDQLSQKATAENMLLDDARNMSLEDFITYERFMGIKAEDLTDAELTKLWNKANGLSENGARIESAITEGMSDAEKDEVFINAVQNEESARAMLLRMRDSYKSFTEKLENAKKSTDPEILEDAARAQDSINRFEQEVPLYFRNLMKRDKEMSAQSVQWARTSMLSSPRMYRDLYGFFTGDETMRADIYDDYLPDIDKPSVARLSIADRRRLSEHIANQRLKDQFLSGKETYNGMAEKLIEKLSDEIAKLRSENTKLANENARILKKEEQLREARRIHDYKLRLANTIMLRASNLVDYEYRTQIQAIQATIDPKFVGKTIWFDGRKMTIEQFRTFVANNYIESGFTKRQADILQKQNLNDLTVEDLEELAQTVEDLKKEGRQVWQAKQDALRKQAEATRRDLLYELSQKKDFRQVSEMPHVGSIESKTSENGVKAFVRNVYQKTVNMDRKAQMLDNGTKATAYDLLLRKRREVEDAESIAKRKRTEPVYNKMVELGVKADEIYEVVPIQIGNRTEHYSYSDLFYALCAEKNKRNYRAFAYGNLVSLQEKKEINRQAESKDVANSLIEATGDAYYQQVKGQALLALQGNPNLLAVFEMMEKDFQNNAQPLIEMMIREYNTDVALEDYYMPIYRADHNGTKLAGQINEEHKRNNPNSKNASLPSRRMINERIDISALHQTPVHLDYFGTWLESIEETEHLIATIGYERELKRVFQNRGSEFLRQTIEANYGRGMVQDIDNYISHVGNTQNYQDRNGTEKIIRQLRGNVYGGYLGFKASAIVLQAITSPAATFGYANPFLVAKNLLRMGTNFNKTWDFVASMSEFMRNRSMDPALDIIKKNAVNYSSKKWQRQIADFIDKGTMGLTWIDRYCVTASWMAIYEQKLSEFDIQSDEENMRKAAAYADEIIAETQPVANQLDLAPLFTERSEAMKAFMQFTTSLNVIWNNITYDVPVAFKNRAFAQGFGTIIGYALAGIILGAVRGEIGDDEEDDASDVVKDIVYNSLTQFTDSVPLAGSVVDALSESLITGESSNYYKNDSLFPGLSQVAEGLIQAGKIFHEEPTEQRQERLIKSADNILHGLALFAGLPTSGIKESVMVVWDDENNEWTFNPAALLGQR